MCFLKKKSFFLPLEVAKRTVELFNLVSRLFFLNVWIVLKETIRPGFIAPFIGLMIRV